MAGAGSGRNLRADLLLDAAKRYRVDVEKLQKAVSVELATKRDKKSTKVKKRSNILSKLAELKAECQWNSAFFVGRHLTAIPTNRYRSNDQLPKSL